MQELAKKLWDYQQMHHVLKKVDAIFVLGSSDIRSAQRAAELYNEGYAPLIIMSGGHGAITKTHTLSEAERFAAVAHDLGVPYENIIMECSSTNTGDNIKFSRHILAQKNIDIKKIIAIQKTYTERRAYATLRKQWPEVEVIMASPLLSFEEYPNDDISIEVMVNKLVDDVYKIKAYPAKGFQIPQDMPDDVWDAWKKLVSMGYTQFLPPEALKEVIV